MTSLGFKVATNKVAKYVREKCDVAMSVDTIKKGVEWCKAQHTSKGKKIDVDPKEHQGHVWTVYGWKHVIAQMTTIGVGFMMGNFVITDMFSR